MNTNSVTGPSLTPTNYRIVNERVDFAADLLQELHARKWSPKNQGRVLRALVGVAMEPPKSQSTINPTQIDSKSTDPSDWRKAWHAEVSSGILGYYVACDRGLYLSKTGEWRQSCGGFLPGGMVRECWYDTKQEASAALASCTTPPPGWKETACSKESASSSAGSSSAPKPQPSTPTPTTAPALCPASEVAKDICDFDRVYTRGYACERITADRVAVLEWMHKRFFAKGLAYAGEAIDKAIEELKGTP